MSSIKEVFSTLQKVKVLLIGDVMLDSYIHGEVSRISPESPVPVVDCNKKEQRLGGSANVALNMQAMGATTLLYSVVGDDAPGRILLGLLDDQNIVTDGIVIDSKRPTTVKQRVISRGQQLLRIDEEKNEALSQDIEHKLTTLILSQLDNSAVSAVVFQDYDKGVISPNMITRVSELAKKKNIPVLADPKHRNFLNYTNITLFKPNLKELSVGIGKNIDLNHLEDLKQYCSEFKRKQGIEIMMITLSEKGIFVSGQEDLHFPTEVRFVADVSGAGDTVISIATICLALGLDLKHTVRLSNLGGGQVCEKPGVVPVDKEKLLERYVELYGQS